MARTGARRSEPVEGPRPASPSPDPIPRPAPPGFCCACARQGPLRWAPGSPPSRVRGRRGGGAGRRRPGKHGCSS
ncbi:hypothetical protein A6R68_18055 [Neotoma lepida]|uniref:Uncharacterized protein n=1 Tax=Neotoma lepida TaxID=56216 RepID=A0A1A6HM41_NEOLE|nr:hypothetical protein A6R68_18055 [Neotoma lepida]